MSTGHDGSSGVGSHDSAQVQVDETGDVVDAGSKRGLQRSRARMTANRQPRVGEEQGGEGAVLGLNLRLTRELHGRLTH